MPICAALLNYIAQELFVACSAGVSRMDLPPHDDIDAWQTIDFRRVQSGGKAIHFRQVGPEHWKRFVTFLGKEGYEDNLLGSKFINKANVARICTITSQAARRGSCISPRYSPRINPSASSSPTERRSGSGSTGSHSVASRSPQRPAKAPAAL